MTSKFPARTNERLIKLLQSEVRNIKIRLDEAERVIRLLKTDVPVIKVQLSKANKKIKSTSDRVETYIRMKR